MEDGLIEGDSSITTRDGRRTIEFHSFSCSLEALFDPMRLKPDSRLQYHAVEIIKRVDQASPLLTYALGNKQIVDTARFTFFRPSPSLDGPDERYFTIELHEGRVVKVKQSSTDGLVGEAEDSDRPMLEEVSFTFKQISWTHEAAGTTSQLLLERSEASAMRRRRRYRRELARNAPA